MIAFSQSKNVWHTQWLSLELLLPHITPILQSLHWLIVTYEIEYKVLPLTYSYLQFHQLLSDRLQIMFSQMPAWPVLAYFVTLKRK